MGWHVGLSSVRFLARWPPRRPGFILGAYSRQIVATDEELSQPVAATALSNANQVQDLSSPRAWLEYHPDGAYTVLRCDYWWPSRDAARWHVWGLNFHRHRLEESYDAALVQQGLVPPYGNGTMAAAWERSMEAMNCLLTQAAIDMKRELPSVASGDQSDKRRGYVMMLTLLWHPHGKTNTPWVRAHIYSTLELWNLSSPSPFAALPATLMLALSHSSEHDTLVSRRAFAPLAKLSAWCSMRQPLETLFKREGADVDEVVLCDADGSVTLILEGLTSNLIFVYPDNVLRTPAHDVLHGYARHLVLQAALTLGYSVRETPVAYTEAALWQEVYKTSAMQLLVPVGRILVPSNGNNSGMPDPPRILWSRESVGAQAKSIAPQLLRRMYEMEYDNEQK